jgi:indolepyruvate ferredoxin oxidoreductase alpha subunit
MVIVTAGDPGNHTSPNEQDHRLLAKMARLPMLEPATPEQARALTVLAFDLSEELGVPVLLRPTTRVSHTRGVVELGERRAIKTAGKRLRDPARFVPLPPNARRSMPINEGRLETVAERLAAPEWSIFEGDGPLGVISCGVAACYVREAVDDLDAARQITHLQVPSATPLPGSPCRDILDRCHTVLVVEELQPVVEEQIRSIAVELDDPPRIVGKLTGSLPRLGEYSLSIVRPAIARLLEDGGAQTDAPRAPEPGPLRMAVVIGGSVALGAVISFWLHRRRMARISRSADRPPDEGN